MNEEVTVAIRADTSQFAASLGELEKLSAQFGAQLTGVLKSAVIGGKQLDDVLRQVGLNLAGLALDQGMKPLQALASSFFAKLAGNLAGVLPFAKGGVPGSIMPFAAGGVVSAPTFFNVGGRTGLMGEAGAEAILPLRRGPDGSLGVASQGSGAPVNVTFNVTAADAASFARSEAQLTGMLARAVSRGVRRF